MSGGGVAVELPCISTHSESFTGTIVLPSLGLPRGYTTSTGSVINLLSLSFPLKSHLAGARDVQ